MGKTFDRQKSAAFIDLTSSGKKEGSSKTTRRKILSNKQIKPLQPTCKQKLKQVKEVYCATNPHNVKNEQTVVIA